MELSDKNISNNNAALNINIVNKDDIKELSKRKIEYTPREKDKLEKIYNKYKIKNKLIIERVARKTIRYIEKNTENFPNKYRVLRDKIIESCYTLLESIIRANVYKETCYKKEAIVQIQMLNFYLEEVFNKNILTEKKFISYTNHLLEVDKMVRSWITNEKNE